MQQPPRAGDTRAAPWTTRVLAALGFVLALGLISVAITRELAIYSAQSYMRQHYNTTSELPIKRIRPEFLTGTPASGKPLPPLGFCWTIEMETSGSQAQITIDPWTHEVVEWHAAL